MARKIERECPICFVMYLVDPVRLERHGAGKTCSRSCGGKLTGIQLENRILCVCSNCGAEFTRSPAQIKSKHEGIYCSRTCHYAGRGQGMTRRVVTKPYVIVAARPPGFGYQV